MRKWVVLGIEPLTMGIKTFFLFCKKHSIQKTLKEIRKIHAQFERSFDQMRVRAKKKVIHPKPRLIQDLEEARLSDLDEELDRLKTNPRIAKSLEKVPVQIADSKHRLVAFAHSLELQEALKETHYVINHGQSLRLMLVNLLTRKLKEELEEESYASSEILRHNIALRHIYEESRTVEWYQNTVTDSLNDHHFRKELICGDCFLESSIMYESALFFSYSPNIALYSETSFEEKIILEILYYYFPDMKIANQLYQDLGSLLYGCPGGGNLYSICVPKEKFDDSCYFSAPGGISLKNQKVLRERIEEMQSGKKPDHCPQIRILTHKIRPEDGYYVMLHSTIPGEQLQSLEEEVSRCIKAALAGYRIKPIPQNPFNNSGKQV